MSITSNYPVSIVDNFFNEPYQLVDLANNLKFYEDKNGRWPGVRSENLSVLYPELGNKIVEKILSLHHNFLHEEVNWQYSIHFQKVAPKYLGGWIHQDHLEELTAIIYFCNEGFGTSIFKIKDIKKHFGLLNTDKKIESFTNTNLISEYEKYRIENNENFEKTIFVESKFNRLLVFEGIAFHGANNFVNFDNQDRLTMVVFIRNLESISTPVRRTKNQNCSI